MKCRDFDLHLPDWTAGRLSAELSAQMQSHSAACPACARAVSSERDLRARWLDLPAPQAVPDLWPRLSARLQTPRPAPRWLFPQRLALGGALAAAGGLAVFVLFNSPKSPEITRRPPVDERRVVRMVAEMQELPDPGGEAIMAEVGGVQPAMHYTPAADEDMR